jgi:hypothetical protein
MKWIFHRKLKRIPPIFIPLVLAAGFRLAWILYTRLTFEDAFITFRFARNLANDLGFVYNAGYPIYGSTTPLFTLLMAGWLRVFPDFVVFGATMFGLLAGVTSIFLVWKLLDDVQVERSSLVPVIIVLILSSKLWTHDMGGMETPLVVCAMMASYWMLVRNKLAWSGVFAGILLWVRVDGLFWIAVLVLAAWVINRRVPYPFLTAATLVYLPWMIFATVTFGSPIPYTITAKIQAYYGSGHLPLWQNFLTMLRWLTPISLPNLSESGLTVATAVTCLISFTGVRACRRNPWLLVLPIFCAEEMLRLVLMGETYESRYFVPLYWALMLLFGLGAAEIWHWLSPRFTRKKLMGIACLAVYCFISLYFSFRMAQVSKDAQYFLYDMSRAKLGLWLNKNTPAWSTVFLEPLGYIGFYADRFMVDQVGLVTPRVVALKNAGTVTTFGLVTALDTDYVVLHCDDALNPPDSFLERYTMVTEVNPLDFDPVHPNIGSLENASKETIAKKVNPRTACYQVWKRH